MRGFAGFLAVILLLAGAPTRAQDTADDQEGKEQPTQGTVESVYLDSHARIRGTTCNPTHVSFSGKITTDGPAFVTYRWIRSDGVKKNGVIQGAAAATGKVISTSWDQSSTMSGWVKLVVLTPKHVETPKTYFWVHCGTS